MAFENLAVQRLILHEVYQRRDDGNPVAPRYGGQLVSLPANAMDVFKERIVDALGSNSQSMEMEIAKSDVGSAVEIASSLLGRTDAAYITQSQKFADKLTDVQIARNLPGGMLVVFSGTVGAASHPFVAVIKAETQTGLQHAHSELTHDTIYKPSVVQTPAMQRAASKSMALIEATSDYFEELVKQIREAVGPNKSLSEEMTALYKELIGTAPDPTKAEGLLNDAYAPFVTEDPITAVRKFVGDYSFVPERIKERAKTKLLFRQPSILLAYMAVQAKPEDASSAWPLTPTELKPIFTDLGQAAPAS